MKQVFWFWGAARVRLLQASQSQSLRSMSESQVCMYLCARSGEPDPTARARRSTPASVERSPNSHRELSLYGRTDSMSVAGGWKFHANVLRESYHRTHQLRIRRAVRGMPHTVHTVHWQMGGFPLEAEVQASRFMHTITRTTDATAEMAFVSPQQLRWGETEHTSITSMSACVCVRWS